MNIVILYLGRFHHKIYIFVLYKIIYKTKNNCEIDMNQIPEKKNENKNWSISIMKQFHTTQKLKKIFICDVKNASKAKLVDHLKVKIQTLSSQQIWSSV